MTKPLNNLPFSQACENNKSPILQVLQRVFEKAEQVLEIGSGTGQHAVYFSEHLPHLTWTASDRQENLEGIQHRLQAFPRNNLTAVAELDVTQEKWPNGFDAVFSANTAHIMPWDAAQLMLTKVSDLLPSQGLFALYGPFKYQGEFTSDSNARFDEWLKNNHSQQGIRDFESLDSLLGDHGMCFQEDNAMPANNQLLVWQKQ